MRQTILVDVLATSEATVVEVRGGTYLETNPAFVAQGYAKKHPNDSHDVEIGHSLAISRALRELADAYEKRAKDRIESPGVYVPTAGLKALSRAYAWDGSETMESLDRLVEDTR